MKKVLIGLCTVLTLAFAACTRDDDNNSNGQGTVCDCNVDVPAPPKTSPPLNDSLLNFYIGLWKSELQQKNNMSNDYFNAHIKDTAVSVGVLENGDVVFRMDYLLTIDWAKIRTYDEFAIRLSSTDDAWKYLNTPRDVYYDAEWVKFCIAHDIFSHISRIQLTNKFSFVNCDQAKDALRSKTGYTQICPDYLSLDKDGYAQFSGSGIINSNENKCVSGSINLVTGKAQADNMPCFINIH